MGQAAQAGLVALLLGKLDWRRAGAGVTQGEDEVLTLSLFPCVELTHPSA